MVGGRQSVRVEGDERGRTEGNAQHAFVPATPRVLDDGAADEVGWLLGNTGTTFVLPSSKGEQLWMRS